jgi:hypothetical protein
VALTILVETVLVHLIAIRITQCHVVVHRTLTAVRLTAAASLTVVAAKITADHTIGATANVLAAITSSFQLQHQAAEHTCSAALHLADNLPIPLSLHGFCAPSIAISGEGETQWVEHRAPTTDAAVVEQPRSPATAAKTAGSLKQKITKCLIHLVAGQTSAATLFVWCKALIPQELRAEWPNNSGASKTCIELDEAQAR